MRTEDSLDVRKHYARDRTIRSIYGGFMSAVGCAMLVWLPAGEWVRITIGFLLILLGGVMINAQAVKDWFEVCGDLLPFGRKKLDK